MINRYTVLVTIEGHLAFEADSFTSAENKANEYIQNFDFGDMQNIDWSVDAVIDENGNAKL